MKFRAPRTPSFFLLAVVLSALSGPLAAQAASSVSGDIGDQEEDAYRPILDVLGKRGLNINTRCAGSYGPNQNNIAVSTDWEVMEVGYLTMGVFFSMKLEGCDKLSLKGDKLLCDGRVLGTVGKFESTSDNDGEPRAQLKIDPSRAVHVTGDCRDRNPLKFEVLK